MAKRSSLPAEQQSTWPRPIQWSQWLALVSFCMIVLLIGGVDVTYLASRFYRAQDSQSLTIPTLPPIPVLRSKVSVVTQYQQTTDAVSQVAAAPLVSDPPLLTSTSYYAFDLASQTQLAAKQENQVVPPASTTKLLTAMVALDTFAKDTDITMTSKDMFENPLQFTVGEIFDRDALLAALLIHSSNEAAYALAHRHEKGIEGFVADMNTKAQHIGLINSHFTNPAGFDDPKQITTARDLSVLARAALEYPEIKELVRQPTLTISAQNASASHQLVNTNRLLTEDTTVEGIKTGTTEEAKEVLISQFNRDGHEIQIVVLGSQNRYADTKELLEWILTSYQWVVL